MRATSPWTIPIALLTAAMLLYAHEYATPQTGPPAVGSAFCGFAGVATPLSTQITAGSAYASTSISNGTVFTPTIPTLSQGVIVGALFLVTANSVRERHDGTSPTSDAGALYGTATTANFSETPIDKSFVVCGSDLGKVKLTPATTNPAIVHMIFYGQGR